jgi:hypothetical protein
METKLVRGIKESCNFSWKLPTLHPTTALLVSLWQTTITLSQFILLDIGKLLFWHPLFVLDGKLVRNTYLPPVDGSEFHAYKRVDWYMSDDKPTTCTLVLNANQIQLR